MVSKAMGSKKGWRRKEFMSTSGSKTGELLLPKPIETLMHLPQVQMLDVELQDLMLSIVSFNPFNLNFHCFFPYLPFGMRKFIFVVM